MYGTPAGRLASFMAYPFSDLRWDATVAIGIDDLAAPGARSLGVIGTGRLAGGLIEAITTVRKIDQIRVFSRREAPRAAFATRMQDSVGVPVQTCDDAEHAVGDADIVLTITSSTTPTFRGEWLASSALVVACGLRDELDADV